MVYGNKKKGKLKVKKIVNEVNLNQQRAKALADLANTLGITGCNKKVLLRKIRQRTCTSLYEGDDLNAILQKDPSRLTALTTCNLRGLKHKNTKLEGIDFWAHNRDLQASAICIQDHHMTNLQM
jgi:hypothetical protein